MANIASIEQVSGDLQKVLQKVADDNIGKGSTIMKLVTLDILGQVVKNTRVDTGALRNNWQVSRNLKLPSKIIQDKYTKTGSPAIRKGRKVTKAIRATDIIFIQNNLPYAEKYEREDHMLKNAIKKLIKDLTK